MKSKTVVAAVERSSRPTAQPEGCSSTDAGGDDARVSARSSRERQARFVVILVISEF
jgi:hypothetical protein